MENYKIIKTYPARIEAEIGKGLLTGVQLLVEENNLTKALEIFKRVK